MIYKSCFRKEEENSVDRREREGRKIIEKEREKESLALTSKSPDVRASSS